MEDHCDSKNESLAFTINFENNSDFAEKTKMFERLAQRSSLRQQKSQRQDKNGNTSTENDDTLIRDMFTGGIIEKRKLKRTDSNKNIKSDAMKENFDIQDTEEYSLHDNDDVLSHTGTYTVDSKCKPKMCPHCTKMCPLCLSFGADCPKNGVGLAQLLDQKFDFFKVFIASKFKYNPLSIEVKKKIHYHIFKWVIFMIFS